MTDDVQAFIGAIESPPVEKCFDPGPDPRRSKEVAEKPYWFFRVDYVNPEGRTWRAYRVATCEKHAIDAVIGSHDRPIRVFRVRRFNRLEFFNHLAPGLAPRAVLTKSDLVLAHRQGLLKKFETN